MKMNIEEVVWPTDSAGASVMTHDDIRRLQRAIHQLYGCQSAHTATIPLTEQRCGKILWQGEVQIFHLQGHGTAQRCYAWTSRDNNGKEHHTAVLEVPPVDTPLREVTDLDVRLAVRLCRDRRDPHDRGGHSSHSDEAAGETAHEPSRAETLKKVS